MIGSGAEPRRPPRARRSRPQWLAKRPTRVDLRAGGTSRDLAVLAPVRRGAAPGPRARRTGRAGRPGRRAPGRHGRPVADQPDARPRPDRRPRGPATLRRHQRLPPQRRRPLHQPADAGRRAAHRRRRRPRHAPPLRPARRRARTDEGRARRSRCSTTGQHELVRAMVSDPRQVALALAPAGSGKTTAMSVLAGSATTSGTTTSAWPRRRRPRRCSARRPGCRPRRSPSSTTPSPRGSDPGIGPRTVIVIDEAGMADTPTLDRVIAACCDRGARVRLIGDDQQLAAVGAGGVLRDIATTHGAVRLEEVVRFADPVEAQRVPRPARRRPSRARVLPRPRPRPHRRRRHLPGRRPRRLGRTEQAAGRECLMLAPTRDLVARLNHGARASPPGRRATQRRGRAGRRQPGLRRRHRPDPTQRPPPRHQRHRLGQERRPLDRHRASPGRQSCTSVTCAPRLQVTLPAEYVAAHVELGYATTVHAAQGCTADVMHGILTGAEDRQLLYTMLTRGRAENHLHLVADAADALTPSSSCPASTSSSPPSRSSTASSDRDGAAVSATTELAHAISPATQLHEAAQRYADAVTDGDAPPARADAEDALEAAGADHCRGCRASPIEVREHPEWSTLPHRARRPGHHARRPVRRTTELPPPSWRFNDVLTTELREDVIVWRAANGVPDDDRSLARPTPADCAADRYARHLQRQVDGLYPASVRAMGSQRRGRHRRTRTPRRTHPRPGPRARTTRAHRAERRAHPPSGDSPRKPLPDEHRVEALTYRVQRMVTQWRGVDAPGTRPAPTRPAAGLEL